ncbi:hypothetical protein [Streptomyces lichenis]|uniref:Uncharacterized protein n=1 Tax=Streptomyces lichenis TaxID=2306967 RepID=A0ABT0IDC6_9ACTN|nr:hypothetical protein [Streptomyces lichenis]MCK8679285.1 hypothetical protein [Streptomyces lichenis]
MTERDERVVRGLPDGGAEVAVVLRLRWDDIAALGREASRLAEQRGAPVSLDDAVSHRLRTWSSVAAAPEDRGGGRMAEGPRTVGAGPTGPSAAPAGVAGAGGAPVLPSAGAAAEHPGHPVGRLGGPPAAVGAGPQHAR